jgi:[acyl-carrier-protein] S-malonyltransferase
MTPFAFVFPGQGSQSVGMLDAWGDHPAVRQTLDEAAAALDVDVGRLIREGPKEQLDLTTNTQPVMLVAGVACYRAWLAETKAAPDVVAGHSLGEYSALVAAGALSFAEALPLVRFRAEAMQEAVPVGTGAMAAILGLEAGAVIEGCIQAARELGTSSRRPTSTIRSRPSSPARRRVSTGPASCSRRRARSAPCRSPCPRRSIRR